MLELAAFIVLITVVNEGSLFMEAGEMDECLRPARKLIKFCDELVVDAESSFDEEDDDDDEEEDGDVGESFEFFDESTCSSLRFWLEFDDDEREDDVGEFFIILFISKLALGEAPRMGLVDLCPFSVK